jgi:hypothetical protein
MKAGRGSWLAAVLAGGLGMAVTAAIATFPRLVAAPPPRMRITALGPAVRIDPLGQPIETLADGALLHDGPTTIVTGSTCETYGRGVVLLPFTNQRADAFQIRIARLGALAAVRALARVVRGSRRAIPGVTDYLVHGIAIDLLDRAPAHTAGEVWWPDGPFTIRLARERVQILSEQPRGLA